MATDTLMMDDPRRARLEARIMERLGRLDESTLKELDAWLSQPIRPGEAAQSGPGPAPALPSGTMTRRQALMVALLGSTAIAGAGVAGGYLGQNNGLVAGVDSMSGTVNQLRGEADAARNQAADTATLLEQTQTRLANTSADLAESNALLASANEIIALFDQLEGVNLDDVVNSGLNTVAGVLGRTADNAQSLREGLARAQNNINQLDESLAVLDGGLSRAENAISGLSNLVQGLEDRLRDAGEPVAPLTTAIGGFFTRLLGRIPLVGQPIVDTIERVQAVLGAIPESIENINRDLIEPLRARFFPREGDNVTVRLLDPLTDLIFTPADRLLGTFSSLGESWQNALERPTQEKLERRAELRQKLQVLRDNKNS